MVEVSDTGVQTVNVSWSPLPPVAAASNMTQVFSLTVNNGSYTEIIGNLSSETYYEFTAPDDAPPCETYNFSITAASYGTNATYSGAGCLFIGTYLNKMLPSLPDAGQLNTSLQYTLVKQSIFTVNVSFEV